MLTSAHNHLTSEFTISNRLGDTFMIRKVLGCATASLDVPDHEGRIGGLSLDRLRKIASRWGRGLGRLAADAQ